MLLLIEALHALVDRIGAGLDVEGVLDDLPRDALHLCRTPHKCVLVASEEVDELAFQFGV
jgi:hypothetical protein